LRDCRGAAQVGHVADVDTLGHDQFQRRVAQKLARDLDRDRPEARDLADVVAFDPTPAQRIMIDADQAQEFRLLARRVAGAAGGERDERVECVGLSRFASARAALNCSLISGSSAARTTAPSITVPRATRFHAPSASVYSRSERSPWIRACVASRSTRALVRKHSSRSCDNGARDAYCSNSSSASGATLAAA